MKNKKLSIFLIIIIIASFKVFSIGCGVQLGGLPSLDVNENGIKSKNFEGNLSGNMKFSRLPVAFGLGLNFGKEDSDLIYGLSLFADYWTIDEQINNNWNFYSGFGAACKLMMNSNKDFTFSTGPRFFAGMNWLFMDNFVEYFAQLNIVPTYMIEIEKSPVNNGLRISIPFETGVRLHF